METAARRTGAGGLRLRDRDHVGQRKKLGKHLSRLALGAGAIKGHRWGAAVVDDLAAGPGELGVVGRDQIGRSGNIIRGGKIGAGIGDVGGKRGKRGREAP